MVKSEVSNLQSSVRFTPSALRHHSTVVVQGFCKAKVGGSNPPDGIGVVVQLVRAPACHAGSCEFDPRQSRFGSVSEWLKETDCKSVGSAYDGSNPSRPI